MHQKRNPTTVSRLLTQIQDLQNKVNSLSDAREFHDHETATNSLVQPTFPEDPLPFRVPDPCLAAILDFRMIHGILWVRQETFSNDFLLENDKPPQSSTIQRIWHILLYNWDLMLKAIRRDKKVPVPRFQRGAGVYDHTGGTYSHSGVVVRFRDFRFRNCIWENFLTRWNFKAGKSTSRMKYVQNQRFLWISKVN